MDELQRLEEAIERAALATREANLATKAADKARMALEATLRTVPRLVDEAIADRLNQ